jgi:thymidylate kinase
MRIRQPTGLHVVFLGPDGSGKSTVIQRVYEDLKPVFRRRARYHLFPLSFSKGIEIPVTNPHGQRPRTVVLSVAKLTYLMLRYSIGWLLEILPARIRSTGIFFDRYYHDLLVDPKRYRYGGPIWLAHIVGRLIPKPDLWILLDAPAEVIQARKSEVSSDETKRQRQAYLDLVPNLRNVFVIDASLSIENVAKDVNQAILNFMAKRTAERILAQT